MGSTIAKTMFWWRCTASVRAPIVAGGQTPGSSTWPSRSSALLIVGVKRNPGWKSSATISVFHHQLAPRYFLSAVAFTPAVLSFTPEMAVCSLFRVSHQGFVLAEDVSAAQTGHGPLVAILSRAAVAQCGGTSAWSVAPGSRRGLRRGRTRPAGPAGSVSGAKLQGQV